MSQEEIDNAFKAAGGIPKPQPIVSRGRGAPSDYKPEYCDQIIAFFDVPTFREVPETWYNPDGSVKRESLKLVANPPAHIGQFARTIGVDKGTVYKWAQRHPEFGKSVAYAHDMRRAMIIDNALLGLYNPVFAKLAAANMFNWHDRQDVNHTGEVKSVMVRYHKPEREGKTDKQDLLGGEEEEKKGEALPNQSSSLALPIALKDPKGMGTSPEGS